MRIAICTPVHSDPKADFTVSLARMLSHTYQANFTIDGQPVRPEIEIFMVSMPSVTLARDWLVSLASEWRADFLLWLDADHVFPAETLGRLLMHDLPAVGANYVSRRPPLGPVAKRDGKPVWTTETKANAGEIEEVDFTGFGVFLLQMSVFEKIEQPFFDTAFEDMYFFEKLRAAGLKIMVDHGLSWRVGHIAEHINSFQSTKPEDENAHSAAPATGAQ